jgi:hypothetical protein
VSGASPVPSAGGTRPRIGRYLITGRIGRGGMGMVYRGHDEALDRDVAVKTLTLDGSFDDESRKRFEVEAKAAAKLQHPNIVTVFELNQDGKIPYIAMELLPGFDLESLLRSGEPLLLSEKLDIVAQICRGLHYAHERHVVHRDIKPSNIRLLDDGSVKIMDFGIAKLANTNLTRSGMMVGTVHYMCPEQIQGQSVDGRSDVFSVGVILFELLAGRRPFEGTPGNATEVLYKIVQEPIPALPDLGPPTRALQEIVNRALAKKADDRYATAGRLADDLAEMRAKLDVSVSAPPSEVLETIQAARQLVRQGRVDEGVTRLREVVQRTPQSLEARRALRVAAREAARHTGPVEPDAEFPELTFQVGAMQETAFMAAPPATSPSGQILAAAQGKTMLVAGAIVFGFALVAGAVLLMRSTSRDPVSSEPGRATAAPITGGPTAAAPIAGTPTAAVGKITPLPTAGPVRPVRVTLSSEPAGAAVTLDGKPAGHTPIEIDVDPERAHQAVFALDGYAPRRVTIPSDTPRDVSVTLATTGPPGLVTVASAYPVDVTLNEQVLVKAERSPSFSLPAGRHTLRIVSAKVALRTSPTVEVKAGETHSIALPALGELNAQAYPDNCKVFVDGFAFGDLPIRKEPVTVGTHTVVFKWPDGAQDEKTVEVGVGAPGYATGEKN